MEPEKESFMHLVGFFLLMIAFLVVTYKGYPKVDAIRPRAANQIDTSDYVADR